MDARDRAALKCGSNRVTRLGSLSRRESAPDHRSRPRFGANLQRDRGAASEARSRRAFSSDSRAAVELPCPACHWASIS